MWNILEESNRRSGYNKYVWCECSCGLKKEVLLANILNGKSTKCINCSKKKGSKNPSWTGYGNIPGKYWNNLKSNCSKRSLQFNLTIEYIDDLLIKQNFKCNISGIDIGFQVNSLHTASIDRIDNRLGYLIGNVQWLHKDINSMKSDYEQNYFIELCKRVFECQKNKATHAVINHASEVVTSP